MAMIAEIEMIQAGKEYNFQQSSWPFHQRLVGSLLLIFHLMKYCPINTDPSDMNTEMMWLIYAFIAIISPIGLILAKNWVMKDFKVKHES